jgi:2-polyprenyl-3-methyl-5-hydroxy-6-metoxy-1,4-benzoquinol methylase
MKDSSQHVLEQIKNNNPWYTDSHFEFANMESIKRIYEQRSLFFYKILKKLIDQKGKIELLDCGCGDGYWSLVFSQYQSCKVTGVDYNPIRLDRAKIKNPNVRFLEADVTIPDEKLGKHDIVLCNQVIEHIKDDVSFLSCLKRYIKDDGVLILGTTNEGCITQKFRNYFEKGKIDHVHFYKEDEIVKKITGCGYVIKNIYREVFYPCFDKIYYKMTSTDLGFKVLELLTILFPSQCSDYYFLCEPRKHTINKL